MRVLVLGATKLIGNSLLRAAIDAGWETVAFDKPDRRRRRHPALRDLAVEIALGQEEDPEALRRAMSGCQVLFHAAGYAPPNSLHHQRRLTSAREHVGTVLKAAEAAGLERLVYTSSTSTIGRSDSPTRPPDEWNSYRMGQVLHPYWDAKWVQEEAVFSAGRKKSISVVVLNVSEVVGPFDFELEAAATLLEMAQRGIRQYLPGKISIADVRDVAQGHIAAAEKGRSGERYILAGHNITRQEMMAIMARACKQPAPDKAMDLISLQRGTRLSERISCIGRPNRPFPLSFQIEAALHGMWYDSGKARDEFGYTNRPLLNSYRATLAWLQEINKLKQVKRHS